MQPNFSGVKRKIPSQIDLNPLDKKQRLDPFIPSVPVTFNQSIDKYGTNKRKKYWKKKDTRRKLIPKKITAATPTFSLIDGKIVMGFMGAKTISDAIPSQIIDTEEFLIDNFDKRDETLKQRLDPDNYYPDQKHYEKYKDIQKLDKEMPRPGSIEYNEKHMKRYPQVLVKNPSPRAERPRILAFSLLSLCHADVDITITKFIEDRETLDRVLAVKTPTITRRKIPSERTYEVTVNYARGFIFKYKTVSFDDSITFSNLSSCTSIPTYKTPNIIFSKHDIVQYETDLLLNKSPKKSEALNSYFTVCRPKYKDYSFQEVDSAHFGKSSTEHSRKAKKHYEWEEPFENRCSTLILHNNYSCKSLLNKLYESQGNEVTLSDGTPMLYDAGKMVLLTKIQYGHEEPIVIKTILLGPEFNTSIKDLFDILHKRLPSLDSYFEVFKFQDGEITYNTKTENIIDIIKILGPNIPLKIFDSSCNTLSEEITHKLDENPEFKMSSELLISNYFLNRAKQTEDIHGGTRKNKTY